MRTRRRRERVARAGARSGAGGRPVAGGRPATWRVRVAKLGLAAGYLALGAAVVLAHRAPATGYELSLYRATPMPVWAGVTAAAVLAAVAVVAAHGSPRTRLAGLWLATLSVLAVAALPVVRGYHFYGAGDALTHLGWVRELAAGSLDPFRFLYPGIHLTSVFGGVLTGVRPGLAMQYLVLAYLLAFLVFVPLCARIVGGSDRAFVVGTFAALLALPINDVSTHLMAHPATQAIFFSPVVLYLALRYLVRSESPPGLVGVTATGVVLALASVAVVLLHPQIALNLVVVFLAVSALQWLYRGSRPRHPVGRHRPLYLQTAIILAAFLAWSSRHERVEGTATYVVRTLLGDVPQSSAIAQRGASLATLGGSIEELFVKLFLPALVFSALSGVVMAASLLGRLDSTAPEGAALGRYFAVATVPLAGLFAVFFLGSGTQYFRYFGFGMVIATVLGAVALAWTGRWRTGRAVRTNPPALGVVVVALLLPLSTMTMFASPFVYQPTQHVTEGELAGYATLDDARDPEIAFVGVRHGPERIFDAIYGSARVEELEDSLALDASVPPAAFAGDLRGHFAGQRYLVVSERAVAREIRLYDGFRYPRRGFQSLRSTPGIDCVQANGEVHVFLIDGTNES